MERGGDSGEEYDGRSRTYFGNDTAKNKCVGIHGIFEGIKQFDDILKMEKHEISIQV